MKIRVFCPCRENEEEKRVPVTLWDENALYRLEYLLFCDICMSVRCERCVDEEVICRFCPSCLFEVTIASAKTDNNQCMRSSCFECPECISSMSVVKEENGYRLVCNFCDYKSSMLFDKSSSIGRQLVSMKNKNTHKRFYEFRRYYHRLASSELTNGATDKPVTFNQVIESKKPSKVEPILLTDEQQQADTANNTTIYPKLRRLQAKRSKRCRGCRNIIIKPEPKPTSTKFKTKLLAMNYIPAFRVTPHFIQFPEKFDNVQTYTFRLNITNPLFTSAKVRLATATPDDNSLKVTIITPTFELGPAPELWDDVSLVKSQPSEFIGRKTIASEKVFMEGLRETGKNDDFYEKGPNWVSVLIEVVPLQKIDNVKFGLFTNFSYIDSDNVNSSGEPLEPENVSVGFWTVVDFETSVQ